MIGSRAVNIFKTASRFTTNKKCINLQQVRHSGEGEWSYRTAPTPAKWAQRSATGVGVLVWWWFYWNLYHGWGHITGVYDGDYLQDPRTYTDEELGIPPDDA